MPGLAHKIVLNPPNNAFEIISDSSILCMKAEAAGMWPKFHNQPERGQGYWGQGYFALRACHLSTAVS